MSRDRLLLEQASGRRSGRLQDGEIMVEASNLRWCSDALEFACWNGEVVRMAFIIDAFDRGIIAATAISGAGISGSDICDLMLEAVERRFGATKAPKPLERLSDNGGPYTAKETRDFAIALNLIPCLTPVRSPESNGMAEAFVKTFKRDHLRLNPLPDAKTALRRIPGWIEDYNEIHPLNRPPFDRTPSISSGAGGFRPCLRSLGGGAPLDGGDRSSDGESHRPSGDFGDEA